MPGREEIGKCFEEFFINLFSSSSPSIPDNLDDLISPILSEEDLAMLSQIPIAEEIKEMVFSLGSKNALGLDGILAHFYKFY